MNGASGPRLPGYGGWAIGSGRLGAHRPGPNCGRPLLRILHHVESGEWWPPVVQAECHLDDSGGVWELACEDTIGFIGLAELVRSRGGAGAEDEVVFPTQAISTFGVLVHFVAEPLG